ncbi:mechanosensitive ion channel family protein [Marichromatium bheemlicum]|uniref:Mechanosensitive ion channel family protein n=1 Tax=Marichromatium bheemlicum TaxID=365339 RepID=A0ABX1I879_9GAMM|nr:mechanosensitive ion channel family protein [Marichromatium bheemlicum]NKN32951.1 mechanosensitive ion channel family protein [Marichromatium bheemlicum]
MEARPGITGRAPSTRWRATFGLIALLGLVWLPVAPVPANPPAAIASAANPLRPPDTSSPRATLQSLLTNLEHVHAIALDPARPRNDTLVPLQRAARTLDLSETPERLAANIGIERALLLKEIIDRVGLPVLAEVPDARSVERHDLTRWRIPNTEIIIARVESGPRTGEFLFTPGTLDRLEDDYDRIAALPYLPEATPGLYDAYISTPGRGLSLDWGRTLPEWLTRQWLGQTLWQWLATTVALVLGALLASALLRAGRRADQRRADTSGRGGTILALGAVALLLHGLESLIDAQINLTGAVVVTVKQGFVLVLYGVLAWLVTLLLHQAAEAIIRSRRLRPRGIDSQLLRLGFRLLTIIAIAALVIDGAQRIGLPAYSVITGLGVGGLAVALAARETLANLFGSLAIMFDRPFRIGDWIKMGDYEGTVEDIGFRSTRIRTFYDSVLAVPNAYTMNATIDNMGKRDHRRVYTTIDLRYDTPPERIEAFLEGIKGVIRANPATRKDGFHVVVSDLGAHGITVMLYFFLTVPDWATELVERQRVLLEVVRLADRLGVGFAFPTQTLEIDATPGQPRAPTPPLPDERLVEIARDFGPGGRLGRPRGLGLHTPPHEED